VWHESERSGPFPKGFGIALSRMFCLSRAG
jgi:hypothetical protein